ncbi:MAG: undecaprenyldiphospho-muramoylpentapeptide beta-N-acetylglucosaminyltransferase [Candidatus Cloacimonadales bacterium]
MKFIISAGGTGGHIMPAISIAEELRKRGHEILYIGNKNSMEEKIVAKREFPFEAINVQKLYRSFTFKHFLFPFKLFTSIIKVKKIFKKYKPDAYIGCGGFVSGPSGFVARGNKVPYFLQEQNSYPGLTTRALEAHARNIFIGQTNAQDYLKNKKVVYSGNPLNKNIIESTRLADMTPYSFDKNKKTLFLIGGSQGSRFLNILLDKALDSLLKKYNIIWQLGKGNLAQFEKTNKDKPGLYMFEFSYEIDALYNIADIAICRSGAITIAELEVKRIPAILIPLPTSAENHQHKNALEQSAKNIAITLEQINLDDKALIQEIDKMSELLDYYKSNFTHCVHLEAVNTIVDSVLEIIK